MSDEKNYQFSCCIKTGRDQHVAHISGFSTLGGLQSLMASPFVSTPYTIEIKPIIVESGIITPLDKEKQTFYIFEKLIFPHNVISNLRLLKNPGEQIKRFRALNFTPNNPLYYYKVGKKVGYLQIGDDATVLNSQLQELWSDGRIQKPSENTPISPTIMALFNTQKTYNG